LPDSDSGRGALYEVAVDWAPAYELTVSLEAFRADRVRKTLDCGRDWVAAVRRQLPPDVPAKLRAAEGVPGSLPPFLVLQCPEPRDAEGLLGWLTSLSVGDLFELAAAHVPEGARGLDPKLGALRDRMARDLDLWNRHYFRHIDKAILQGLEAEAAARKAELAAAGRDPDPEAFVEGVTSGMVFEPHPGLQRIYLVPQHHFRPINLYDRYRTSVVDLYPADAVAPASGRPPHGLVRLTRALGDEGRLRMLRALAEKERTFTDMVRLTGLAKSTVYHHLVILRSAGLLRVRVACGGSDRYSFRPGSLNDLQTGLKGFLQ